MTPSLSRLWLAIAAGALGAWWGGEPNLPAYGLFVIALSILPTVIHIYRENREEVHARVRSRGREGVARPAPEDPPV